MTDCSYCGEKIPEGRYPFFFRRVVKLKNVYCCSECQHRASILRMGLRNDKYMPKNLDETDENYLMRMKAERHAEFVSRT